MEAAGRARPPADSPSEVERMPYQFYCPQGHLLQGLESQAGQFTQCPFCGLSFVMPAIPGPQPDAGPPPGVFGPPGPAGPQFAPGPAGPQFAPEPQLPQIGPRSSQQTLPQWPAVGPAAAPATMDEQPLVRTGEAPPAVGEGQPSRERTVHIPCPQGHELETPWDMLGQDALCPICNVQFKLKYELSREFETRQKQREYRLGKKWLNWAIAAAILVGLGLLTLVAVSIANRPSD